MKKSLFILVFLLSFPVVFGATIQGMVYDFSLEPLDKVVLEVNTLPLQTFVLTNGSYTLELPLGNYTFQAHQGDLYTEQSVFISQEGVYTVDLILFPTFSEEATLEEEPLDLTPLTSESQLATLFLFFFVVGLLIFLFLVLHYHKKDSQLDEGSLEDNSLEKKPLEEQTPLLSDSYGQKALAYLQQEQRTTQKDLRTYLNLSEAKVSLLVTELEHKGIIEKIKKGRSNIIILKRG